MTPFQLQAYEAKQTANGAKIGAPTDAVPAGTEYELMEAVVEFLKAQGIFPLFSRFGHATTFTPGAPDLLFAFHGKPVGVELKTKTGKLSIQQQACHMAMRKDGWFVFVCHSVPEVAASLKVLTFTE